MYMDDFSRNNWYKSVESNDESDTRVYLKKKKCFIIYYPIILLSSNRYNVPPVIFAFES